ncbi:MAG: diguanylate cyclase domain-containing protein [Vulcanimicrobiaceae bacterium]
MSQEALSQPMLAWSSDLYTGIDTIDEQHKRLIAMFNSIASADAQCSDDETLRIQSLLRELLEYTNYHFRAEAELMLAWPIDASRRTTHLKEHAKFVAFLGRANALAAANPIDVANHLLAFLAQWILHHIMVEDTRMAREVMALQSGVAVPSETPAEPTAEDLAMDLVSSLNDSLVQRSFDVLDLNRQLRRSVDALEYQALHDSLTGLFNRRALYAELDKAMARARRHQKSLAVCMLDLDDFKSVNDTYGHEAGDVVLVTLGKRLQGILRKTDFLARLSGDEFVLLVEDIDRLDDLTTLLKAVQEAAETPISLQGDDTVRLGTSMGIVIYPFGNEDTGDVLLRLADQALYDSKAHKGNREGIWTFFDQGDGTTVLRSEHRKQP